MGGTDCNNKKFTTLILFKPAVHKIINSLSSSNFMIVINKAIKKDNKQAKKIFTSSQIEGTSPSHKLEDYDGYYDHPGYGVFELFTKKDSLFAATPYITMWLDHYHYDTFVPVEVVDGKADTLLSYNDFLVKFSSNNKGEIEGLF